MRRTILLALAAVMLGGCPEPQPAAPAPDAAATPAPEVAPGSPGAAEVAVEQEPNEARASANLLAPDGRVRGFINPPRPAKDGTKTLPDQDWYRVQVPAGEAQVLRAELTGVPGLDLKLELTDADGNDIVGARCGKVGAGEIIPNAPVPGGATVYLRVREIWDRKKARKFDEQNPYGLSVAIAPLAPGEEHEPNSRKVDANLLKPGQMVSGYLGAMKAQDWFRLDLSELLPGASPPGAPGGDAAAAAPTGRAPHLRLELSGLPGVRPRLIVYDEIESEIVAARAAKAGAPVRIRNLGVDPERRELYVALKTEWDCNPAERYTLTVTAETPDRTMEFEPNDSVVHATPLQDGQVIAGYLFGAGDADWYRLDVTEPSHARLELSGLAEVDLRLAVLRDEATLLRKTNEGRDKEPETITNVFLEPGTAYLRVTGRKGEANPDRPYTLKVLLEPDTGIREREPNDAPEAATPIALEQTLRGFVHPGGDHDHYLLDLRAASGLTTIEILASGIPKVDTDVVLLRAEPDEEGQRAELARAAAAPAEREERLVQELPPGTYLIRIQDNDDKQSNPRDEYRLTVGKQ